MKEALLEKIWLGKLLESEQILINSQLDIGKKNTEITTIILLDQPLEPVHQDFLVKILQSCGIESNKYYLFNKYISLKEVKSFFPNLKNAFVFGLKTNALGINISLNSMDYCLLGDINIITSLSLSQLVSDIPSKNFFWNHILKPVFVSSK